MEVDESNRLKSLLNLFFAFMSISKGEIQRVGIQIYMIQELIY